MMGCSFLAQINFDASWKALIHRWGAEEKSVTCFVIKPYGVRDLSKQKEEHDTFLRKLIQWLGLLRNMPCSFHIYFIYVIKERHKATTYNCVPYDGCSFLVLFDLVNKGATRSSTLVLRSLWIDGLFSEKHLLKDNVLYILCYNENIEGSST